MFFLCVYIFMYVCICADRLMADEFSAELAEGVAYVAGHDDSCRPVMVLLTNPL